MRKNYSRRGFVKLLGSGIASVYLGGCASVHRSFSSPDRPEIDPANPFDRQVSDSTSFQFSGDQPDRNHRILWDKRGFITSLGGRLPAPEEKTDVLVVGGGLSGLISAYFLKDHHPIVLEQASRFGGNSRGESWKGIDYSIGAGYTAVPPPDSDIENFWKEIGVNQKYRIWKGSDSLFVGNRLYQNYWQNGTLPGTLDQFKKLHTHFTKVLSTEGLYPEIPSPSSSSRRWVNQLDQTSFHEYIAKVLGGKVHPQIEEILESYAWTAFAASTTEISASAGVNFFLGDFDAMAVFPGGNAAIAEGVYHRLKKELRPHSLRSSCLVFDIRLIDQELLVSYVDEENRVKAISAKKLIVSCPKFVFAKMMDQLEPERLEAIRSLKYRSYLIANLLVDQKVDDSFYDLYFFSNDPQPLQKNQVQAHAQRIKATDLFHGCYSKPNQQRTVLTLSRAFPYDQGRTELYSQEAYAKFRAEFEDQIDQSILPLLQIPKSKVVDLRLTRWGHPIPVPAVGIYKQGKVDWLRKPIENKVFFVEQDNWALPCFETAFEEAKYWTSQLRQSL